MNNDINCKDKNNESKIIKDDEEKNDEENNNETKIIKYNLENNKKRKLLNELEEKMKIIKKEINITDEKIQKICVHDWERIIIYGDPTSYECVKCGLWRRR